MSGLCAEKVDYKNLDFLYQKAKGALSIKGGLTRTEIADLINDDPRKHTQVYGLLGQVFKKYSGFEYNKGKYFLKNKV